MTKYPLLLKGIRQNTAKADQQELGLLDEAIEKAESVLRYVQEAVRETEDRHRLKELHDRLDTTGLVGGRKKHLDFNKTNHGHKVRKYRCSLLNKLLAFFPFRAPRRWIWCATCRCPAASS
mgnify:CR=1 FL=1